MSNGRGSQGAVGPRSGTPAAAAIVLAGGASARMGTDKVTLVVDGERMIDRVLAGLRAGGVGAVAVSGPDPGGLDPSIRVCPDPPGPRQGPLAGVCTTWRAMRSRWSDRDPVLVLSADLVTPSTPVLETLVAAALGGRWGAVAHDGERSQPLVAAYRPRFLDLAVERYEQGERSLSRIFAEAGPVEVRVQSAATRDADTRDDLGDRDVIWPRPC